MRVCLGCLLFAVEENPHWVIICRFLALFGVVIGMEEWTFAALEDMVNSTVSLPFYPFPGFFASSPLFCTFLFPSTRSQSTGHTLPWDVFCSAFVLCDIFRSCTRYSPSPSTSTPCHRRCPSCPPGAASQGATGGSPLAPLVLGLRGEHREECTVVDGRRAGLSDFLVLRCWRGTFFFLGAWYARTCGLGCGGPDRPV